MINKLKKELEKIKIENELLIELLETTSQNNSVNVITRGSRVKIVYEDGKTQVGRVMNFNRNRGEWMINRDGYAGTIGIPPNRITLVSPGLEGLIDTKLWLQEIRRQELERIVIGSDLSQYLKDKEYVNVKIAAKYKADDGYCFLDIEIFEYNPVQRIKLPDANFEVGKYLQLHIAYGEISEVHYISKERYQNQE